MSPITDATVSPKRFADGQALATCKSTTPLRKYRLQQKESFSNEQHCLNFDWHVHWSCQPTWHNTWTFWNLAPDRLDQDLHLLFQLLHSVLPGHCLVKFPYCIFSEALWHDVARATLAWGKRFLHSPAESNGTSREGGEDSNTFETPSIETLPLTISIPIHKQTSTLHHASNIPHLPWLTPN